MGGGSSVCVLLKKSGVAVGLRVGSFWRCICVREERVSDAEDRGIEEGSGVWGMADGCLVLAVRGFLVGLYAASESLWRV